MQPKYDAKAYLSVLATEQPDERSGSLDALTGVQIAGLMNQMDAGAVQAVTAAIEPIGRAIEAIAERMRRGGRLIYTGAGTSGRLGVLDASECPPTFGVSPDLVLGMMAGGERALRFSVEGAEDDTQAGAADLEAVRLTDRDTVVAISASGYAPYCIAALEYAKRVGALAVSLCCNADARLSQSADIAIEAPTGSEALAGSTRLKAGTATKMILNMLSTGVMTHMGKVYQNLMVDMQASNDKLKDRAERIIMRVLQTERITASALLRDAGFSLKTALIMGKTGVCRNEAEALLAASGGNTALAIRGGIKGS